MSKLKVLALASALFAMNCFNSTSAQAGPCYTLTDTTVSEGSSCAGAITFPDAVTAIAGNAFQNATSITSITFGPGSMLTSIGAFAFAGASSLESVTFNAGSLLSSIGAGAFAGADHLTGIVIPNGVTTIEAFTFSDTTRLATVILSNNITTIGTSAFNSAAALTSVIIPSSVTAIGTEAFSRLPALTSVVFAPNSSLTSLADYAFYRNPVLSSINIPATVTSIGAYTFADASLLESVYFLGLNAPTVGLDAFSAVVTGARAYIETGATGFGSLGSTWNGLLVTAAITTPATQIDVSALTLAAQKAAEAKREAEKKEARSEISKGFSESKIPTIQQFATAEISGVTEKNLPMIIKELMAMPEADRSDLKTIEKISTKYLILDTISSGGNFTKFYAKDLSSVGLIPEENQVAITYALRQLPLDQRDDYEKIVAAINKELEVIRIRAERLAAVLA